MKFSFLILVLIGARSFSDTGITVAPMPVPLQFTHPYNLTQSFTLYSFSQNTPSVTLLYCGENAPSKNDRCEDGSLAVRSYAPLRELVRGYYFLNVGSMIVKLVHLESHPENYSLRNITFGDTKSLRSYYVYSDLRYKENQEALVNSFWHTRRAPDLWLCTQDNLTAEAEVLCAENVSFSKFTSFFRFNGSTKYEHRSLYETSNGVGVRWEWKDSTPLIDGVIGQTAGLPPGDYVVIFRGPGDVSVEEVIHIN